MARPRKSTTVRSGPVRAVGYIRVSTSEQADSGAGLAAQRSAIAAEIERRGWDLVEMFTDAGASGRSVAGREALARALGAVESECRADVIIVAKLDRLSRSLVDFAGLLSRAQKMGWNLVALDLGVDLSTSAGRFLAHVMGAAAEWEREVIGQRTREAMAAKRAAGVRLGRPSSLPVSVAERIVAERAHGGTFAAIAAGLEADGIPTATGGGRWFPATVRQVLNSQAAATVPRTA